VPPNPPKPEDSLFWNGKLGLEWSYTQCTDFWQICMRGLNTPQGMNGQVRWFAREDSGDLGYTELTRIALELIRADIVCRQGSGKKDMYRHHRIIDLRRVMSKHAEALKATLRIASMAGRPLPPLLALDCIKAARQGEPRVPPPKFDPDAVIKMKTDFAGALPFPASSIASAWMQAEVTVAERREAFRAIYNFEISRSEAALPGGIDLPIEFFNPNHSVFMPNGDFVRTDSDQYATDFAVGFAWAPVWEKAQLLKDYIGMEISRIDTQMILMLAGRKELEAIRNRTEKDYRQWLVQRQALEQSYRDVARISQEIVDLRAKTGPDGRASRGLYAQHVVNRFILQNSPAGNHPLGAIPKPVQDAAAAARFTGGLANRGAMFRNVSRSHLPGAILIPHQQQHLQHQQQLHRHEQHQRYQQSVPAPTRAQSVGAWSKRSATPSGGQQAYSDIDSPTASSAAFLTSSRLETEATPARMLSSQDSMTSITGGAADGYTDDRHQSMGWAGD
jgi:hypothetical protein